MILQRTVLGAAVALLPFAPRAQDSAQLPLQPTRHIEFETTEGTWLSPDLSPDGERIVFELLGDLYVLDARGGVAQPIATGMAFDSQPAFSSDAAQIVFISDRSGSENVWVADSKGGHPRPLTDLDEDAILTSPAWSADGSKVFVSRYRPAYASFELLQVVVASGAASVLIPIETRPDTPADARSSVVGAAPSRDGKWLYYAAQVGSRESNPPGWIIKRRNLATGADETVVEPPRSYRPDLVLGTFFRPAPSPDGRLLVYGTRYGPDAWLRVLDLQTGDDRWLAPLKQRDELLAAPWRDLLPHFAFTPDSGALIVNDGGGLVRISLRGESAIPVPFKVQVKLPLGPSEQTDIKEEKGPVRARLIQNPLQSPNGRSLAFSTLGYIYSMRLDGHSIPRRLTSGALGEYQPSWSPDGRWITYVRWTARDAGHVWRIAADGSDTPIQVTSVPAFYSNPVFTPDGRSIVAVSSSSIVRMHRYMEYGPLRDAQLLVMPVDGGAPRQIAQGNMGGVPHFSQSLPGGVELIFDDGLNTVALDGSGRRNLVQVTGPGYYFLPGRANVDDLRLSPDGKWVLAQVAQQLHLLPMPASPGKTIDVADPDTGHRKLTDVGADFLQWAGEGTDICWALGSTWYRQPLNGEGRPEAFTANVEVPRDMPRGVLLLQGATVLTMRGEEAVANAELLIVNDRFAAIGPAGSIAVPKGATVRDVTGKWIVPGFIDDHDHVADVRRVVLDAQSWGPAANLAYGVTTAFDPSTLSIDMLAYQDLIDAGLMIGSRIRSTGPALFSFNEFKSRTEVDRVLERYTKHYRLSNVKLYRTGSRRVRQWIAQGAHEKGLRVTTEGAGATKLDLSQIQDGLAGAEHALPAAPLYEDVIQLMARSGVSYNTTLMVSSAASAQDYFIVAKHPNVDRKLNRLAPRFIVDMKTRQRTWRELADYPFPEYAASAARIMRAGGIVGMGSHGEVPGLGFHWEMEGHVMGGWKTAETLYAATMGSAKAIGLQTQLGSIERGKIADLVILHDDPRADIRNTLAIDAVMKSGRLYDGNTLAEIWPRQREFPTPWYRADRPPGTPDPAIEDKSP